VCVPSVGGTEVWPCFGAFSLPVDGRAGLDAAA